MWYPAKVTVPPASEPVTLAEAKSQCGVAGSDKDAALNLLIGASRAFVENYCGIRLVEQTVEVECDDWADFGRLTIAPLIDVTSIEYIDTAGVEQTLPTSVYLARADNLSPSITLKYNQRWPSIQLGSRIKVTAQVGYETVPGDLKYALLLSIGKHFSMSGRDMSIRSEEVEGIGTIQRGGIEQTAVQLDAASTILLENYRTWPL